MFILSGLKHDYFHRHTFMNEFNIHMAFIKITHHIKQLLIVLIYGLTELV